MEESIRTQLVAALAADHDEMVEFTKGLVAIATENPPGAFYKQCIDAITDKLNEIGLVFEVVEVPVDRSYIVSRDYPRYSILGMHGSGRNTLYFHGHYDVVPRSSAEQFVPRLEDGSLFGRGSSDMKSGLASMIFAVKAIKSSGLELGGSVGLTIVPDEETGGQLGSQYLAGIGMLGDNGVGMLTAEPTSGCVWNASRGAISLRITVNGVPVHVGLQHQGVNAFERMVLVAGRLGELKREVESRTTRYNIQPQPARHSILMLGGRCEGGTSFNLVPGECSFTVDRRINPEEDLDVEKRRLMAILERFREDGIDIDIEVLQEGESAGASEDHPIAQALARNIEAVTGERPRFEMCPGVLETRFYAAKGVPGFAYGPGLLSVSHGPDEHVCTKNIVDCASVYALTALDILCE